MLDSLHLIDPAPVRRYLLSRTQHLVGGFGKLPGDPPDMYHAYLGLAALSLLDGSEVEARSQVDGHGRSPEKGSQKIAKGNEPTGSIGLAPLDPALCMSVRAREWLEGLSWRKGAGA